MPLGCILARVGPFHPMLWHRNGVLTGFANKGRIDRKSTVGNIEQLCRFAVSAQIGFHGCINCILFCVAIDVLLFSLQALHKDDEQKRLKGRFPQRMAPFSFPTPYTH